MSDRLSQAIDRLKNSTGWSWKRIAEEINLAQGGKKGITGPTLYRYSKGTSQPQNEMIEGYILDAIEKLENPVTSDVDEFSGSDEDFERVLKLNRDIDSFYQKLYFNTPVMLHSIGRDGRLLSVNQHWLDALGYQWQEVIGRKSIDFLSPKSRREVELRHFPQFSTDGSIEDLPLEFIKKNGEIFNVQLCAKGTFGGDGKLEYSYAVMFDASKLRQSAVDSDLWQSLMNNSPDLILSVDPDGAITYINRILPGFSQEETIGTPVYEFVNEADRESLRKMIGEVCETGEVRTHEARGYGPHREQASYESHIGPLIEQGEIRGATIISSDITERTKMERRYRLLFERNISGVFRSSLEGELLDCNDAFAQMLGYASRDEIIAERAESFYFDMEDRTKYIARLKQDGYVQNYQLRHRKRDGTALWVLANASLIEDELGERRVILGSLLDITEKKLLEDRLRRQNEYLQVLHDTALGVISHTELDVLVSAIMTRAGSLVGTEHGFIYLADPGTLEMSVKFGIGELRQFIGSRTKMGQGLAGRVWQTGRTLAIEDYRSWPDRLSVSDYDMIRSIVGVPLKSGREVVGVIGLAHLDSTKQFGDEEISILTEFAELVSIALDNVKLYEQFQRELHKKTQEIASIEQKLNGIQAGLHAKRGELGQMRDNGDGSEQLLENLEAEIEGLLASLRASTSKD